MMARSYAPDSAYRGALDMATATLAAYDRGTASHSDDVVTLCLALTEELGIEDRDRAYLLAAAELHDIGKVAVPPGILAKPAPLDDAEWKVVREHTVTGHRILGAVPELAEVARIVRHCHERWDGGGYPDGLAGEQIPLASRVVFCADAYHAIRGDRPYRRGRSSQAALSEVEKHRGAQFDPVVVTALRTVAERTRARHRFSGGLLLGSRRSQRLAALLLTLALAGSALAATGIWNPGGGRAATDTKAQPEAPARPAQKLTEEAAGAAAREERRADAARRRDTGAQRRGAAAADGGSGERDGGSGQRDGGSGQRDGGSGQRDGGSPGNGRGRTETPAASPPRRAPVRRSPPAGGSPDTRPPVRRPEAPQPKPKGVTPVPVPIPAPQTGRGNDDRDDEDLEDDDDGSNGQGNGHDKGRGRGHDQHDH